MAFSKEVEIKLVDSLEDLFRNMIANICDDTDKVICEELVNQHKDMFKSIYERSNSKEQDSKKDMEVLKKIYLKLKNSIVLMDEYEDIKVTNIKTKSKRKCLKSLRMLNSKVKTKERLI